MLILLMNFWLALRKVYLGEIVGVGSRMECLGHIVPSIGEIHMGPLNHF